MTGCCLKSCWRKLSARIGAVVAIVSLGIHLVIVIAQARNDRPLVRQLDGVLKVNSKPVRGVLGKRRSQVVHFYGACTGFTNFTLGPVGVGGVPVKTIAELVSIVVAKLLACRKTDTPGFLAEQAFLSVDALPARHHRWWRVVIEQELVGLVCLVQIGGNVQTVGKRPSCIRIKVACCIGVVFLFVKAGVLVDLPARQAKIVALVPAVIRSLDLLKIVVDGKHQLLAVVNNVVGLGKNAV